MSKRKEFSLTRRRFLVSTGWLAAGSTVVFQTGCLLPTLPTIRDNPEEQAFSWLQVGPDSKVRFYMGKAEMGQGVMTGLTQLVAEELAVAPADILVQFPSTLDVEPVKMTVGSESIQDLYAPVRHAAASLRERMKLAAARQARVNPDALSVGEGGFRIDATGEFLGYGKIAAGDPDLEILPPADTITQLERGKAVGQPVQRLDLPGKVDGSAVYAHDVRLPGMLYGAMLRPPALGASLISVDGSAARAHPGVVKIVVNIDENFVGVVASSELEAREAVARIRAKWKIPKLWQQADVDNILDLERLRREGDGPHKVASRGDPEEAYPQSQQRLERSFTTPFGAHAQMETHAAVADVKPDSAEVWLGTQDAFFHQGLVAGLTGLSKDRVIVYPLLLGGGFGGKVYVEAAVEAARLSQATGRPVKVIWSREENLQYSYFRPPSRHRIQAGLDDKGRIAAWDHEFSSGLSIFGPGATESKVMRWGVSFVPDKGTSRGSLPPYDIPNRRVRFWDEYLHVPTGPWRGLGASINNFARESMMDEMAHLAGRDPLAFRLEHLTAAKHHRLRNVLEAAAKRAGWGQPLPPGVGRGIACGIYQEVTYVAVVAQVRLDRKRNRIRVEKLVCAHDCGKIINPDSVRAQVEGNLIWGTSTALVENLRLKDGRMTAVNFHQYPVLRITQAPETDVVLLEEPGAPPTGAGESAIMPTPAAIANAVVSAGGRRGYNLPLTPKEVF